MTNRPSGRYRLVRALADAQGPHDDLSPEAARRRHAAVMAAVDRALLSVTDERARDATRLAMVATGGALGLAATWLGVGQ